MTTTKKTAAAAEPTTRRERIVGWAELGVDTATSTQKQWNDITFAYTDLALKAWRDSLSWIESYYEQSRKTVAALAEARDERARAILDRLS
jgi:hypothetical protein